MVFTAGVVGGELRASDESAEVAFIAPADIPGIPVHERLRIGHWVEDRTGPYIG